MTRHEIETEFLQKISGWSKQTASKHYHHHLAMVSFSLPATVRNALYRISLLFRHKAAHLCNRPATVRCAVYEPYEWPVMPGRVAMEECVELHADQSQNTRVSCKAHTARLRHSTTVLFCRVIGPKTGTEEERKKVRNNRQVTIVDDVKE